MKHTRPVICIQCGEEFPASWPHAKLCSPVCRKLNYHKKLQPCPGEDYYVSPGTRGAISELSVAVDLMNHGFDVYRGQSPSSPHDLIVEKNNILTTIEVKTGSMNVNGTLGYSRDNIRSEIIAIIVRPTGTIKYIPESFLSLYRSAKIKLRVEVEK
jgi:hypothetical protein